MKLLQALAPFAQVLPQPSFVLHINLPFGWAATTTRTFSANSFVS